MLRRGTAELCMCLALGSRAGGNAKSATGLPLVDASPTPPPTSLINITRQSLAAKCGRGDGRAGHLSCARLRPMGGIMAASGAPIAVLHLAPRRASLAREAESRRAYSSPFLALAVTAEPPDPSYYTTAESTWDCRMRLRRLMRRMPLLVDAEYCT